MVWYAIPSPIIKYLHALQDAKSGLTPPTWPGQSSDLACSRNDRLIDGCDRLFIWRMARDGGILCPGFTSDQRRIATDHIRAGPIVRLRLRLRLRPCQLRLRLRRWSWARAAGWWRGEIVIVESGENGNYVLSFVAISWYFVIYTKAISDVYAALTTTLECRSAGTHSQQCAI